MKMFERIQDHFLKEPLAGIAILITIVLAIVQSEWFERLLRANIQLNAYYGDSSDGRCPLIAFSLDNETESVASDVRVFIVEDWITASGREELILFDRKSGLISAGEKTAIPYRDVLDVRYSVEGQTLHVPTLFPGEYLDIFLGRSRTENTASASARLATDSRYRFTPRIGTATFAGGQIATTSHGDCIQEFK